jgi:glutamyl-tRNA reductase
LKNLQENGFTNLVICNRSAEKAQPYLNEHTRFAPFSEVEACVRESALVISALSGQVLQIGSEWLKDTQIIGYQYFIDLGMPRSILPEIESLPHAILYNIDQIQSKVNEALQMRRDAIPAVEAIVEGGLEEFLDWSRDLAVSPVIQQMRNSLEVLRKEEMARFTRKLGEEQTAWAEELTKNLMQRIMKTHVVQLKAACRRGDAENLVEVLQQLFQVEENTKA